MHKERIKNKFEEFVWDSQKSILYHVFLISTEFMNEKEFKVSCELTNQLIEKYKPKYNLSDSRDFKYAINPTLQVWVAENVYPRWSKAGLKKLAIVVPKEFISFLSLEQTVDEIVEKTSQPTYTIQYFDNFHQADSWLQMNE